VTPAQLTALPKAKLPLHPAELAGLDPQERGRIYTALDLHSTQISCIEQALRMLGDDTYPSRPGEVEADVAGHLERERGRRELLSLPGRVGGRS
jgi:hypothetical protein